MSVKKVVIFAFLMIFAAGIVSAMDMSGEKRIGMGFGIPNTALIVKVDPFDFKAAYDFTEGKQYLFASGAYTLINSRQISSLFTASVGVGVFAKFMFDDDKFKGGVNIPLALELPLMDDFFEIFLELAPGIDLLPKPAFALDSTCLWLGLTIRLG